MRRVDWLRRAAAVFAVAAVAAWAAAGGSAATSAAAADIEFDAAQAVGPWGGFGVQVWAGGMKQLEPLFTDLHVTHVRLNTEMMMQVKLQDAPAAEYDKYFADAWKGYRDAWEAVKKHNLKVVMIAFGVPSAWRDADKHLPVARHGDFARMWGAFLANLAAHGMRPAYVELFNEPDGDWNGLVLAKEYNQVVKLVRAELDRRGLRDIGIVGPGLGHIDHEKIDAGGATDKAKDKKYVLEPDEWVEALDAEGAAAMAAWSTHAWEWTKIVPQGPAHVRACYDPCFGASVKAKDPRGQKPVFMTEYATFLREFHGKDYPDAGQTKGPSVADEMPYAACVMEMTLSIYNCGAAPFYWQGADQTWSPDSWGLIDDAPVGKPRPSYFVFKTLIPNIPPRAAVLSPVREDAAVYGAAFADAGRVTLAFSNCSDKTQRKMVSVKGASGLKVIQSLRFADKAISSGGATVEGGELMIEMPADSTLVVICERAK